MSQMQVIRTLVTEKLAAAAEEILGAVERMITEKSALNSKMSPEHQRAVVLERLSVVADEISGILEMMMMTTMMMGEREAEKSGSHEETRRHRELQDVTLKTETTKQLHRADGLLGSDCEDMTAKLLKCERSSVSGGGRKTKRHTRTIAPANKFGAAGQSCCRVCGKVFRYKRSFLKHALRHERSPDRRGARGKRLDSKESLKAHLRTHNDENVGGNDREAACSDTESKVSDGDGADSRDGKGDETCSRKSSNTKNPRPDKANRPKNEDACQMKYRCKVCCKAFCYRASFLRHVQEDERDTDVCGVCGERFDHEDSLRLHLQTYVRRNDCEVCGKRFDGHKQLETHTRTHTGEKPFVCAVCGKAFAQNGNLMGHMRAHTGERPYVCSVCGQSFSFKEYMAAHLRIHTGEKPFLCSVCGKGFRQRGTLRTHMTIHTGECAHRCGVCDKRFYKSGALKIHARSHTGEKPYLCNVCGKSFTAGGSLAKHMGVHEGERAHCCGVCGKGFFRREDLKRHAQTHGGNPTPLTSC